MLWFHHLKRTNSWTYHNACAKCILFWQVKTWILKRFFWCRHSIVWKAIHSLCCLKIHTICCLKILYLGSKRNFITSRVKTSDRSDSYLSIADSLPELLYCISNWSHSAQACHNYSSFHQLSLPFCYVIIDYIPPSTWMIWPVMYDASSDARKATVFATCSGFPNVPAGIWLRIWFLTCSLNFCVISVSIKPGATAFTVMPRDASSFAADFVRPITPAFNNSSASLAKHWTRHETHRMKSSL